MESIASFVVVAAVLIFVGWPLFRPAAPALEDTGRVASPPERQKAEAYAAIKEAEFDLRMGKLSESDFAELTQRYRQQALAAIEQLTRSERPKRPGRKVSRAQGPRRSAYCPACGKALPARGNFCGQCGQDLQDLVA